MEDSGNFFQNDFKFHREPVLENNMDINNCDWYYENLSRKEADKFLYQQPEGSFVVRQNKERKFSLSVKCGDAVVHFKIYKDRHAKFSLWKVKFDSLVDLIDYYRESAVSRAQDVRLRDIPRTTANVSTQKPTRVVGKYDFTTHEKGELSFKRGDIITVTSRPNKHWWHGLFGTREGLFPSTYVHSQDDMLEDKPRIKNSRVEAKYDFTAQEEGELSFKRGEIITVICRPNEQWWEGTIGAREGLFPSTYVCTYKDP